MVLLFYSETDDSRLWSEMLHAHLPDLEIRIWPEAGDLGQIDAALVWRPPAGLLATLPRLRLIASLGMGVDHIFADPHLPASVPVARIVDADMVERMGEYVVMELLRLHRRVEELERLKSKRRWRRLLPRSNEERRVGVMGLGAIGSSVARRIAAMGFPVAGWSRTPKALEGIECHAGPGGLAPFLARSDVLVCLLPLTPETRDVLDRDVLRSLPRGAYLINCARGEHLVEEALLTALDEGHLHGASLDVFRTEPLPPEHPFWGHPRIRITPHVAGPTNPRTAAAQVAENLSRLGAGKPLLNTVTTDRGY